MFDFIRTFNNFIDQGGPIVFVLFFISIYLFILLAAKFKFLFFEITDIQKSFESKVNSIEKDEFYLLNLSIQKADFKSVVLKDFTTIQILITLCPVLGLLGTVTGMIEVFDVVSFFGTGNARALASGITKATLPTMTGMAISIVGLLTFTILNSKTQTLISKL
jgi:biopolymer transport protein ExbB